MTREATSITTGASKPNKGISALVPVAGLISGAAALFAVWRINQATDNFNIMGWYAYYILPVGALLVGFFAGSGYGVASWLSGVRINRSLLWIAVLLQSAVYLAAQYVEFRHLASQYGQLATASFWQYFDAVTRAIAFKERYSSRAGDALGGWGYAFRLLELVGFVVGGLLVPLSLRSVAYCAPCQHYMRSKKLGLLPLGLYLERSGLADVAADQAEVKVGEAALTRGIDSLEQLKRDVAEGNWREAKSILEAHRADKRRISRATLRAEVKVVRCPGCGGGLLKVFQLSGQGNGLKRRLLSSAELGPQITNDLWQRV